ncbi:hypothetical protein [uncultured Tenacibaculum sp.]|uniref:hypothetical protein n=1 Tax=uncultured Tenacibaculum sp. TaxID=174713 RepID=UPI0026397BB6|nr:hypothetical protein [uncultured Tenacibaculum sp.]
MKNYFLISILNFSILFSSFFSSEKSQKNNDNFTSYEWKKTSNSNVEYRLIKDDYGYHAIEFINNSDCPVKIRAEVFLFGDTTNKYITIKGKNSKTWCFLSSISRSNGTCSFIFEFTDNRYIYKSDITVNIRDIKNKTACNLENKKEL